MITSIHVFNLNNRGDNPSKTSHVCYFIPLIFQIPLDEKESFN